MTPDLVKAAAKRITGHVRETPLLNAPLLDEIAGRRVFVKAECLQFTGSFKYRGAKSAISKLDELGVDGGILAYSSGNHAQGIALAARQSGRPAVIVMPEDAPAIKKRNTMSYGAEIVPYDRWGQSREDIGEALSKERGLHLIRPYDEPEVIAGQASSGLELARQARDAGLHESDVLVCCGGGGLTAGVALALSIEAPGLRVRTVEPKGFDDVARSLKSGKIEHNAPGSQSICDAIVTPAPGHLTFPLLSQFCGPGLVVTDDEALSAVALAFRHLKVVLEPGGAVALAAALFHPQSSEGDAVIAIATGGNVDAPVFQRALARLDELEGQ